MVLCLSVPFAYSSTIRIRLLSIRANCFHYSFKFGPFDTIIVSVLADCVVCWVLKVTSHCLLGLFLLHTLLCFLDQAFYFSLFFTAFSDQTLSFSLYYICLV